MIRLCLIYKNVYVCVHVCVRRLEPRENQKEEFQFRVQKCSKIVLWDFELFFII
jgi:hypothetical protein